MLDEDLQFLRASAKNAQRDGGRRTGNATVRAIERLHDAGIAVVGGIIVGNPDDTIASIETNLSFARRYVDWPYIQHPTPYPGTPMTEDFRRRNLIVNDRVEEYDGTTAVVKTAHLEADEVEFLRWRAERWMKLRHLPYVLRLYTGLRAPAPAGDVRAHVPRQHVAIGAGARERAGCVPALQAHCGRVNANTCRRCPRRQPRAQRASAAI